MRADVKAYADTCTEALAIDRDNWRTEARDCRIERDALRQERDNLGARIAELEAACQQVDALIEHQFTGSREAMNSLQYACDAARAALKGKP